MADELSPMKVTESQLDEVRNLVPAGQGYPFYKVIPKESIPSIFPESFKEKMDHAVVMVSGVDASKIFVVINARRVECKAMAIDQEPFGLLIDSGKETNSGVFIHHGSWKGRTEKNSIPMEFWQQVEASGIGNCFPPTSLAPNASGHLQTIADSSDEGAFKKTIGCLIELLRPTIQEDN